MAESNREKEGIRKVEGIRGTRWQAKVSYKGSKPIYQTFETRTEARRWRTTTLAALAERRYQTYAESDRHSLSGAIKRFSTINKIPRTKVGHLAYWEDQLGKLKLSDIRRATVIEALDQLAATPTAQGKQRALTTVDKYRKSLSTVFKACVEWEWLNVNPVAGIGNYGKDQARDRYLQKHELTALLEACQKLEQQWPMLYPLVLLAVSTGARAGELLNLRWQDVDLKRGTASLYNTKNGSSRAIAIRGKALDVFSEYKAEYKTHESYLVFPRPDGAKPWEYRNAWNKALEVAGLRYPPDHEKHFRFHDLRHTAGSYLAMNGASTTEVAAVLGHKTLAMAQRYSHLSDSHISDVVERMNEKVLGDG
jgi:integrase